jgi:sugar O-acyltransferase (sialic acid O-acetyltransferase NeuD family)
MNKKIVIYGIGNFSKLIYHYLKSNSNDSVVAFCVDKKYINETHFCNLPLLSFENIETKYPPSKYNILVLIGYSDMRAKKLVFNKVKKKGYMCINYISPRAIIADNVSIGENNIILENVIIEPFTKIGNNNTIWSSVNICHNVVIQSHSFIASKTLVGGFSKIHNNCFIGFNSTIIDNVTLKKESLIGANSLILNDTLKYSKYIGTPAKKYSKHKKHGIKIK